MVRNPAFDAVSLRDTRPGSKTGCSRASRVQPTLPLEVGLT